MFRLEWNWAHWRDRLDTLARSLIRMAWRDKQPRVLRTHEIPAKKAKKEYDIEDSQVVSLLTTSST